MTICSLMLAAIDKRLAEKKTLEEIGCELCDAVDDPRGKAIRIIKAHRGEKYLRDNAEWLGYDAESIPKNSGHENAGRKNSIGEDVKKNLDVQTQSIPEPMQLIQNEPDAFAPDEIVYESEDITEEPKECITSCYSSIPPVQHEPPKQNVVTDLRSESYIPTLEDVTMCPCGCGYGYCETNKKWYTQAQMAQLDD